MAQCARDRCVDWHARTDVLRFGTLAVSRLPQEPQPGGIELQTSEVQIVVIGLDF